MLDTCFYFEADRVECAKRLAGGELRGHAKAGSRRFAARRDGQGWICTAERRVAAVSRCLLLLTRPTQPHPPLSPAQACRCPTPLSR